MIILLDEDGDDLDTLYNDKVESLADLKKIPAGKYTGGKADFRIIGTKNGGSCFEQTRSFDGDKGTVKVDTVSNPAADPAEVVVTPDTLEVGAGGSAIAQASIKPAYADQSILWSIEEDADSIATFAVIAGSAKSQVKVTGGKPGTVILTARSKKDSSVSAEVVVKVVFESKNGVALDKDTLNLYAGGPSDTLAATVTPKSLSQDVVWSSLDGSIAKVDEDGIVEGVKEGQTFVIATSAATSLSASALVVVKLDAPRLTIDAKAGAPVNKPIDFNVTAIQEFGEIILFAWDLDGDGKWDPAVYGKENGAWAVLLSGSGYQMATVNFGGSG